MKLREIFRFEFVYQARRISTWLYFVILAGIVSPIMTEHTINIKKGEYFLNAPWLVAGAIVFLPTSLVWLLITAAVSGNAATRDVRARIDPLTYTTPVSKAEYLGGRFLAAFVLNALILLALPLGALFTVLALSPGLDAELLGPLRPAAYLTAYGFIAVPNAFIVTAIQFSIATLSRRASASYLAGILLNVLAVPVCGGLLAESLGLWELAKLVDPIAVIVVGERSRVWTTLEQNTLLIGLQGSLLVNRLIWLGIALGVLGLTHLRFRFSHHAPSSWRQRIRRRRNSHSLSAPSTSIPGSAPISVPQVPRRFGFTTQAHQMVAITWASFWKITNSVGGLVLLAVSAALAMLLTVGEMDLLGVPLVPRTEYVLNLLTTPKAHLGHWILIPVLLAFWVGELVWQERDIRLSEIIDAAPVPEWALVLGKFLGLSLWLVMWLALLTITGLLVQVGMGYHTFELGLYLQILFGLQLADYLLLALLAFVIHVVVNQKQLANLVIFMAFGFVTGFHSALGIEHNLLIYGADPGWSYTDMRGFGWSLGPWLWFKLYWAAWALLFGVVARLLWVRGRERGLGVRLRVARQRFSQPTRWITATATALILALGGLIFYNTNVLNTYTTTFDQMAQRAEYERRYGQYNGIPQPRLTATNLQVEIYPTRREVELQGTYRLVNNSAVPIESIHLALAPDVETKTLEFDRPTTRVLADNDLGYHMYRLEQPLQPGDALDLSFAIHVAPRGFRNSGVDGAAEANGTYFTNQEWLPAIGYQANRELSAAGDRLAHGLEARPLVRSLYDTEARQDSLAKERISFEAVVATSEDQLAVAPGVLRRSWTENGRRYFHYTTDAPIGNEYAFFSAAYAIHAGQWHNPDGSGQSVAIQIFHQPGHAANLDRMLRSVQAALSYYTAQFGPYPYSHLSLVEHPGPDFGMHAEATLIDYEEGFSLLNPEHDPLAPDLLFSVVAHEVAHQWWGSYLAHPRVEGAILLSETLAQYSAYQVLKKTYGQEHLHRLILSQLQENEENPRPRADLPLLQATDQFLAYRKGPVAIYALSEYIGEERVNEALRRLLQKHAAGAPLLLTSLDLYQELQAVTPDAMHYLLHDLFEANTYWELKTEQATAQQIEGGSWQVTLDVQARKVVVDPMDVETEIPMNDWIEIGIFGPAQQGQVSGTPLYREMHRIQSGAQRITVTVPSQPTRAGIDPRNLLIDLQTNNNIAALKLER